ncbi:hypothetical protein FRC20_011757 [Serendipita sp. 405]|nr:hypothetical protein FRC20_011757 [Serendipita sp. 405]
MISVAFYISVKTILRSSLSRRIFNHRWLRGSKAELALCRAGLLREKIPPLPAEIWSIILDFAIEVPFVFDGTCTPREYHLFTKKNRFIAKDVPFLEDQRRLELSRVCKQWNSLLRQRQGRWKRDWGTGNWVYIDQQRFPVDHPPAPGTRRVDMHIKGVSDGVGGLNFVFPPGSGWEVLGGPAYDLTTIAMKITPGLPNPEMQQALLLPLYSAASHASSLRSLICEIEVGSVSPVSMAYISSHFRSLTNLRLRAYNINGSFNHSFIQCLDLDANTIDLTDWWLPNLRHFAIGHITSTTNPIVFNITPPCRNEDLQSLLILWPYEMTTTVEFWRDYSSLRFLGGPSIIIMMLPPVLHPLAHVYRGPAPIRQINSGIVAEEVTRIHSLKTYITEIQLEKADIANFWVKPYRHCVQRGVKWLSLHETKVAYARGPRWWFGSASIMVASYYFFGLVWVPNPFAEVSFYLNSLVCLSFLGYIVWYRFVF